MVTLFSNLEDHNTVILEENSSPVGRDLKLAIIIYNGARGSVVG
jgi:hypothetical protein